MHTIDKAKQLIEESITAKPKVGLILGSGLGVLAEEINNPTKIA